MSKIDIMRHISVLSVWQQRILSLWWGVKLYVLWCCLTPWVLVVSVVQGWLDVVCMHCLSCTAHPTSKLVICPKSVHHESLVTKVIISGLHFNSEIKVQISPKTFKITIIQCDTSARVLKGLSEWLITICLILTAWQHHLTSFVGCMSVTGDKG
jgi:hypothetical protein